MSEVLKAGILFRISSLTRSFPAGHRQIVFDLEFQEPLDDDRMEEMA